ncbi:hypothetical protein BGW80DRAFT_1276341 [Lactifluus volemus]|nr:hypothetical protein BGW80DRAFT_1276341 [Lactifluus volemus]
MHEPSHRTPGPMDQDSEVIISISSGSSATPSKSTSMGQASSVARSGSKGAAFSGRVGARETAQMGIVLSGGAEGDAQVSQAKRSRKPKYVMTDLPFPAVDKDNYMEMWRKTFIPSLLSWAGQQADPFGTNGRMRGPVSVIWSTTFPDVLLEERGLEIVLTVAENALNNWRSEIGKAGHRAIVDMWLEDPASFNDAEARAQYIKMELEGLRFIYKYPDAEGARAAFCSNLISKILPLANMQFGALALATAAVERGLTLFTTGEDVTAREREHKKAKVNPREWSFSDNPWGKKARMWAGSTQRLDEDHWHKVVNDACAYIPEGEQIAEGDCAEGGDEYEVDLRSCVALNCRRDLILVISNDNACLIRT